MQKQDNVSVENRRRSSGIAVVLKRMMHHSGARIGFILFAILVLVAIFAPFLTPYSPTDMDITNSFGGFSVAHPLGTDEIGRDELARLMYGARYSLAIALSATGLALIAGIIFGALAGYFGGIVDNIIMRFFDVLQAIPGILLSMIISIVLGSEWIFLVIALAVGRIAGFARTLRAQILTIRSLEYIEAAKATNCKLSTILFKHIVPNAMAPLIVQATGAIPGTILATSSLAFIGFGIQAPTPEWGAMLAAGKSFIRSDPKLVIIPGIVIIITILSLNMVGDGLRDALDPKLKK